MREKMNKVADEILKESQDDYDEYDVYMTVYANSDELMDLNVGYVGADVIEGLLNGKREIYLK